MSSTFINEMYNEIDILRTLDHPNIIKVIEVYEGKSSGTPNNSQIYMVLELCSGGDLYARSPYSQREAARIVSKIASALHYMHGHHIVHRDIKFENVMFENTEKDAEIKIIDFGLSKRFLKYEPDRMTERVGTM
jgi:calcium-dependent protein kinase